MKKEVIVYREPKSPISENFKTLRTNIQFMTTNKGIKTLLITSTLPREGKTWISSNLAVAFAQAGKKVVLVDSDMRRGRIYNVFEIPKAPGLSNYLSGINESGVEGTYPIDKYIKRTKAENLFVISSGNVPPNPSELLVSERMNVFINELKEKYDIVIFDGTPSALVTDSIILSGMLDATIIVTAHKQTKLDNLDIIKKSIENVNGKIAGVILNKAPKPSKKYEDVYYYGYLDTGKKKSKIPKSSNHLFKESGRRTVKSNSNNNNNSNNKFDEGNSNLKFNEEILKTKGKTEEILNNINNYLAEEKKKVNEGDNNG